MIVAVKFKSKVDNSHRYNYMAKEYSRKAFEDAQLEADYDSEAGMRYRNSEFMGVHSAEADIFTDYVRWRKSGQAKLEQLLKAGHRDADELNKRYDELLREADKAEMRLREFCESELGMTPEGVKAER